MIEDFLETSKFIAWVNEEVEKVILFRATLRLPNPNWERVPKKIWELMRELKLQSVLIATVVDALMADCPNLEEAQQVERVMKTVVGGLPQTFSWMCVPMDIDVSIGTNWRDIS